MLPQLSMAFLIIAIILGVLDALALIGGRGTPLAVAFVAAALLVR